MQVYHAHDPAAVSEHGQRHDAMPLHDSYGVRAQLVWVRAARRFRHHVSDQDRKKILLSLHQTREISGGDHTKKPLFRVDDRNGSSSLGQEHHALPHAGGRWKHGYLCGDHDIPYPKQSPSERATGMETGKTLLPKSSCHEQRHRERIP
jgi:hypothetical protein